MRSLLWWSRDTFLGAFLGAIFMALLCPLLANTLETFAEVMRGEPPPHWDWLLPAVAGLVSGAVAGAYLGARRAARRVLEKGGVAALPELIRCLLESENAQLRLTAMESLANLGPAARPALPALRIAQRDANEQVREAASQVLTHIERLSGTK